MIASVIAALTISQAVGQEVRLMRFPDIHNDQVVFTYASDLWIANVEGGVARRLTSHPGVEQMAKFSPDGQWIAFTGQYEGKNDVFVIPAEGGRPRQLTFQPTADFVLGWTPDGKIAFRSSLGSSSAVMQRLWLVDPEGGMPIETNLMEIMSGSYSPNGDAIVFNRNSSFNYNWRRYRGGTQGRIAFWRFDTMEYSEMPAGREQNYHPMWVGDRIFFLSDRNQDTLNLYSYNVNSRQITQHTRFDVDIKMPNTDGRSIIYERGGQLEIYDIASGSVRRFSPRVIGDDTALRPQWRNLANSWGLFSISPSGVRVAVEARGDIFSLPAQNGETRNLTARQDSRSRQPAWSPDGQKIAFMNDQSGEYELYTVPQMGGTWTRVTPDNDYRYVGFRWSPNGTWFSATTYDGRLLLINPENGETTQVYQNTMGAGVGSYDWSADESHLVYLRTLDNFMRGVFVYNVETGEETQLTSSFYDHSGVSFDMNGKYLYVISARTFGPSFGSYTGPGMEQSDTQRVYLVPLTADLPNPLIAPPDEEPVTTGDDGDAQPMPAQSEPMRIDAEGFEARFLPLPWGASSFPFVIGANNGVFTMSQGQLVRYDLGSRTTQVILNGGSQFSFNPQKTKLAYAAQGQMGIVDVRPGQQIGTGRVSTNEIAKIVDPVAEWRQMYWEVWRFQRDNFYDPDMLGVDWEAKGRQYESLLDDAGDRSDVSYIFGLLIGELGTGHAYVQGGELPGASGPPVGMLGADFEVVGNNVRITKIFRGASYAPQYTPVLGMHGVDVNEGDYLLEIDGEPVHAGVNFYQYLVGKVNREVALLVNSSPSKEGARTVRVRPISSENNLRYLDWVENNRRLVHEQSGGRIGYFHVPNTSVQGIIEFVRGFFGEMDKDAWIIDERFNGGGWIPTFFLEYLLNDYSNIVAPRHGSDSGAPGHSLRGPKVMLINEYAGSGGDLFPYLFRKQGVGPLIGTRTWGGLVGISGGVGLLDGGSVTSPSFGIYDPDTGEWIAENTGVDPDIEVDNTPRDWAMGKDPQLERGIEYLMDQLRRGAGAPPIQRPTHPLFGG